MHSDEMKQADKKPVNNASDMGLTELV